MLADALAEVNRTGERWTEAELYRLTGELLRRQSFVDVRQAEAYFQQSLDVARHQPAKPIELRGAMSLSRLWQQQGNGMRPANAGPALRLVHRGL